MIGQPAPHFTASFFQEGKEGSLSLKDLLGQNVVLYFYPKDHTPGCTQESCDFRDTLEEFRRYNTIVLGVSKDSLKSHASFSEKYLLSFPLLSDPEGKIAQQYGAWGEKSMFGRKYHGVKRTTVLIDAQGMVQHVWEDVRVPNHAKVVLKAIQSLNC